MKIKPNLESFIYVAVIILCLISLLLVLSAGFNFTDTKIVYQGF